MAGSVGNRQYALVWYIIAVGLGIFCLILASIISIISDKHDIDADTMNYGHTIGWGSWEPGGIFASAVKNADYSNFAGAEHP